METEKEYGHCLVCDNCVRTTWQPHEFADVPRLSTVARCPSPVARSPSCCVGSSFSPKKRIHIPIFTHRPFRALLKERPNSSRC